MFLLYSGTMLFTEYSLTGFWSDIVFFTILLAILTFSLFKVKRNSLALLPVYRILSICILILTLAYYGYAITNPFDTRRDTKTLKTQTVNSRIFHPYFRPVGSWGKGYGSFWITESPGLFPFLEKTVFAEPGTDYNFTEKEFDGTSMDEIVRAYILEEIIAGKKSYSSK
jgi:hypothetical protein